MLIYFYYFPFRLMKQFHLTDENNETLEIILGMMCEGNWDGATAERSDRQASFFYRIDICFISVLL